MKLYFTPRTRSLRPRWLLEELEVPYELITVDTSKKQHKEQWYLEIHPHGRVPALRDGDLALMESAAICMYIADAYPDKQLAPPLGTPLRGLYYQWMVYVMATMELPVQRIFEHTIQLPEAERSATLAETSRRQLDEILAVLERSLSSGPFILGERFSAADVMIGSVLVWMKSIDLLAGHDVVADYTQRLVSRPAFIRAQSSPSGQ